VPDLPTSGDIYIYQVVDMPPTGWTSVQERNILYTA
jgi:hypothetical protein